MSVDPDFRDLFAALNAAQTEFMIVGGYALAAHGVPRFTKVLDVWISASEANADRVWRALYSFGAPFGVLKREDLAAPGILFQMEVPPNRIDIITGIDGVTFDQAWNDCVHSAYGDQTVKVIGIEALIRNKSATGRPQDALDVEMLRRKLT